MPHRAAIQQAAMLVGIAFLVVGIAGFIPGITTNLYDGLEFAGHDGNAELLGIFHISILHNIVHLLFGIAGLAAAATISGSRTFLVGGGAIYLVALGVGMIGLGLALGRAHRAPARTRTAPSCSACSADASAGSGLTAATSGARP